VNDLTRLRDLIVERGRSLEGSASERAAWDASGYSTDGQTWFDTGTSETLLRVGGTWKVLAGPYSASMRRSTTATSVNNLTLNQDLSLNTYWTQNWRESGIAAYNNGWTIPIAGEWQVDFGAKFASAGDIVITVNKSSIASFADVSAYASAPTGTSGAALIQGSKRMSLAAADVVRIFGAGVAASVAWDAAASSTQLSWFGIRYLGPRW
jgi:hypothetical protein